MTSDVTVLFILCFRLIGYFNHLHVKAILAHGTLIIVEVGSERVDCDPALSIGLAVDRSRSYFQF